MAKKNPLSSYTLTFPMELWHRAKLIATVRRQNLREYMRALIEADVQKAIKSKEIPRDLLKR